MKRIEIDRAKTLLEEPEKGHNRWHPDIDPVLAADPGEEVVLETRDASDNQTVPGGPFRGGRGRVHPLTGPVYVNGAEPGDLLEIEYLDVAPQPTGWTRCGPGLGFLPDAVDDPFTVFWDIKDGWATSQQMPGVRIPNGSFMGTAGVAPSHALLAAWNKREADLVSRGGEDSGPVHARQRTVSRKRHESIDRAKGVLEPADRTVRDTQHVMRLDVRGIAFHKGFQCRQALLGVAC